MVYYNILGIFIIRGVGGFIIRGRGVPAAWIRRANMLADSTELFSEFLLAFQLRTIKAPHTSRDQTVKLLVPLHCLQGQHSLGGAS